MKILLVNYHYFMHGGPDRYFMNISKALSGRNHTVVPFSFNYTETADTPYRQYFPAPSTGNATFLLNDLDLSFYDKCNAFTKLFFNAELNGKFRKILVEYKPHIIYSVYLSTFLLPTIFNIAKQEFGIPCVYRLSDFHMMCASYLFYRGGKVCTECTSGLWPAVAHRCVKGSYIMSVARVLQMAYFKRMRCYDTVDAFICPSLTMWEHLSQYSKIPRRKLIHVPTFAEDISDYPATESPQRQPYVLYFGKLVEEKGVEILLRAYCSMKHPGLDLRLVGHVEDGYRQRLMRMIPPGLREHVAITGAMEGASLTSEIRHAAFVAHPSLWLENMPNSILEAMSAGKAVVGSLLGSLPEIIRDGENGLLVPPNNHLALAEAMDKLMADPNRLAQMGLKSQQYYRQHHTPGKHLDLLLDLFSNLTNGRR